MYFGLVLSSIVPPQHSSSQVLELQACTITQDLNSISLQSLGKGCNLLWPLELYTPSLELLKYFPVIVFLF